MLNMFEVKKIEEIKTKWQRKIHNNKRTEWNGIHKKIAAQTYKSKEK